MSSSRVEDAESELKMVHLIFRHADRTPDHRTYPNDPHKSNSYLPFGCGALTKAGYKRMYNNGKFFKKRYHTFLGPLYKQNEVHAQSSAFARTRMSLQLFCAGMFPPASTDLDWNENLNWQPFDYVSPLVAGSDPLLMSIGGESFPPFIENLSVAYAPVIERNKKLFEHLEELTGRSIRVPFDITNLYASLRSQTEFGLDLPEWASQYFPEKLRDLASEAFAIMVSNDALKRTLGGNLLGSMFADWDAKIAGTTSKKVFLYSGHDTSVVGVLGACNVWNSQNYPDFGVTAIFELRQNRKSGEFGVQIFVRNEPDDEPILLTIPGCDSFCPLSEFKTALSNNFPTATS